MTTRKKAPNAESPKRVDRRKTMSTRLSSGLRAKLEATAKESRRSLAQEIERRLEWSYSDPDARLQGFGSEGRLKLLRAFGLAIDMIEMDTGEDVFADPAAAEDAYELLTGMLDAAFAVRPGGPIDTVSPTEGQEAIIKHPAARTSVQNLRDALMESVLPELPGALAAFRKKSKARRKGGR